MAGLLIPSEPEAPHLGIRYQPKYNICNLNCPYCITKKARQTNTFKIDRFRMILAAIEGLSRRICLHIGIEGEIFTSPEILEEISRLCNEKNNIFGLSFLSNISADWDKVIYPFLASTNVKKLSMGCTLHDMVIPDVEAFFEKVRRIEESGVLVYVTYVAVPSRIPLIERHLERCGKIGVPFIMNALIGQGRGITGIDPQKNYPQDYTREEVRKLKQLWDTPHSFKMLVEACPPAGMMCSAGKNYIYVNHEGLVFPCNKIDRSLGNIIGGRIRFQEHDTICPSQRCWCGNQNQALKIVDEYYNRTRNIRIFYPKEGIPEEKLYEGYNSSPFDEGRL